MSDIQMNIMDEATPALRRLAEKTPGALDHAAVRIATIVQRHAKINVKSQLNTTGKSTGNLGRGITVMGERGTGSARVGPQAIYGAIHEFGGTIRPVRAKYLAIPVGELTGSPTEHPDLHLGVSRAGTLFLANASGIQYVLKRSVTIPARPYLGPAMESAKPQVPGIIAEELRDLVGT